MEGCEIVEYKEDGIARISLELQNRGLYIRPQMLSRKVDSLGNEALAVLNHFYDLFIQDDPAIRFHKTNAFTAQSERMAALDELVQMIQGYNIEAPVVSGS